MRSSGDCTRPVSKFVHSSELDPCILDSFEDALVASRLFDRRQSQVKIRLVPSFLSSFFLHFPILVVICEFKQVDIESDHSAGQHSEQSILLSSFAILETPVVKVGHNVRSLGADAPPKLT